MIDSQHLRTERVLLVGMTIWGYVEPPGNGHSLKISQEEEVQSYVLAMNIHFQMLMT